MSNPSSQRFSDKGGTEDAGNQIENDQGAINQLEYFVPSRASGLTLNGLSRINRSIEAFGYCVLGAQANTRSSIFGGTGTARNTQTDFLVLIEDALRNLTGSNGPVQYQDAIEKTKTRLNFALARGVLLMPSRMIINTESIVGYNNNLRKVTDDIKLGVNNHVHQGTKKASLKLMAGGPSKINPPNSHSSNPIHKQATEAHGLVKKKKPTTTNTQTPPTDTTPKTTTDPVDPHHVNKALVGLSALDLVGFVVWART